MPEYLLRVRRFDPESGAPPYWDEHTVELEGHRSVLEGILRLKGARSVLIVTHHAEPLAIAARLQRIRISETDRNIFELDAAE